MNYLQLVTHILTKAKAHRFVQEVSYGDVYEFNNERTRKYANVVLTAGGSTVSGDTTTYNFTLFATDRLTADKSNKLEVQSMCKTILTQILDVLEDVTVENTAFTFWTEKFNDLCAGCYATFDISLPSELVCADDEMFTKIVKEINKNGEYSVEGFDTVKVSVLPATEGKTLTVTENGNYTVLPTEADALSKVEVEVDVWNKVSPTSISWSGQNTLTEIPNLQELDTSKITSMYQMFQSCSSLKELDVSKWDTSNVKDMSYMFAYCSSLKELDVSKWDTSNVTNMFQMFDSCSSLKELDVSGFDTSKVISMGYMFYNCSSLQQLDVSGFDTSKVTSMYQMFYNCSSLKELDVSKWDTSNVTNMFQMFDSCSSLKTVIGNHTLAEVESGEIVACKNAGALASSLLYYGTPLLRYSSLLALANGAYDKNSTSTGTFNLSTTAFNNCRNDDDTIPDADTLAERQAKIRAICAEKNYNLVLS